MNTKEIDDYFVPDRIPEEPKSSSANQSPSKKEQSKKISPEFNESLPSNISAEKVILGSILLDESAFKIASEKIGADDLFLDSHRRIFLRMKEITQAGRPIDLVTVTEELNQHKETSSIGGVAYLFSLTENLPRKLNIAEYVRIVKDKSILRQMMGICSTAQARCADQSEDANKVLKLLEASLIELKDQSRILLRQENSVPFFVGYRTFVESTPIEIDWTVEGLIQKEGNGLILGDPGTSKSLAVFDLALHLVAGVPWFQRRIPNRVRVGLVTREDAPGLSQNRLKRLREGASEGLRTFLDAVDLEDWLYVHTRAQRETWTLQKEADIIEIIESIKERGIQICFFDVFRVLWHGNENDSQETAAVLESAKRISREANCQVALVHHVSKSDRGTIFDRARGSGILGWREWAFGITIENPDAEPVDQIRKMEFQCKASVSSNPIYYRIVGQDISLNLEEVGAPENQYSPPREKKSKKSPPTQASMPYRDDPYEAPF